MKNKKGLGAVFLGISILIAIFYFAWRIGFTLPISSGGIDLALAIVFLTIEMIGMVTLWLQLAVIGRKVKPAENTKKEYTAKDYPEIDVFVIADKKNKNIANDTQNACMLMDYPDKNKVHIVVVEGGMAALNYELQKTKSPLVAIIEAGMFPRHEFLEEIVKCYMENADAGEKIGFIQASQGAFNADSYQFRLFSQNLVPNRNRLFYKIQQPVFDNDNSVVYCGSGAVFARKALNEIGGFDTECISGYTATGIKMQKRGYKCKYLNKTLLSGFFATDIGICIDEWKEKIIDVIEALKKERVLSSKELTKHQKINYLAYITSLGSPFRCIMTLIIPLLCGLFSISMFDCDVLMLVFFWIAIYTCSNFAMLNVSDRVISIKWNNIRKISISPFMLMSVLKAVFGKCNHEKLKANKTNKLRKLGYFVPYILLITLSVWAIIKCVIEYSITGDLINLLMAAWLLMNIYYELMSVFWLTGRPYVRQEDRIEVHINYELTDSIHTICGITRDLSSRGASIWCDKPYDIDNEELINIKLSNDRYQANMQGNVIGVETEGRRWKYVILFKNMEDSKSQYYGILYDRKPNETTTISSAQNIFSDINRNIGNRFKHKILEYRRMARIPVNQNIKLADGTNIFVKNYNYKYLLVHLREKPQDRITLVPIDEVEIKCEKFHKFGEHTYMYKVSNYEELRQNNDIRNKIYEWVEQCAIENIIGMVSDSLNIEEKESEIVKYI